MTITTTALGPNTTQIKITDETSSANVLTALSAAIVAGGWTQYDSYGSGCYRVYRALCKDGTTYKYLWTFVDPGALRIYTSCYESWNATTHVGTNEVQTYGRSGCSSFTLTQCEILLMLNARWCLVQTFVRGKASVWHGVMELERQVTEDLAVPSYPCFMWICSSMLTASSLPRSKSKANPAMVTDYVTPVLKLNASVTTDQLNAYAGYVWDTTKRSAFSMRPVVSNSEQLGKIYGMKATYNVGTPYSSVPVTVDADLNYSATGTSTDHWVLGESVLKLLSTSAALNTAGPSSQYAEYSQSSTTISTPWCATFTGNYYYVGTSGGIAKFDATAQLTLIESSLPGTNALGPIYDICFDGRYIYASAALNVIRLDTQNNDALTVLALPFGAQSLLYDGTWLWATARGSRTNNVLYKVDPSTFTLANTITLAVSTTAYMGISSDYLGNLYLSSLDSGVTAILKVVIATNTVSIFFANYGISSTVYDCNTYWDGQYLYSAFTILNNVYLYGFDSTGTTVYNKGFASSLSVTSPAKLSISRIGLSWLLGSYTGNSVVSPAVVLPSFGVVQASALAYASNSMTNANFHCFEGNRLLAGNYTGYFNVASNLFRPDDQGTKRGRFLLPK